MPLPLILGGLAALAGIGGVGAGLNGALDMANSKMTIDSAKEIHNDSMRKLKEHNKNTSLKMDKLGEKELKIFRRIWFYLYLQYLFTHSQTTSLRTAL